MSEVREQQAGTPLLSVLVVSGGGFQGLALIKALRESSRVRVVVADCYSDSVGRYFADRFYRVPEVASGEAFVSSLRELCEREGVGVVLPSTDFELPSLAEAAESFRDRGVRVAVCDPGFLRLARDKRELYSWLEREGLPVLATVDPRGEAVGFPLIGKPRSGWGGRDVILVRSAEDLGGRPLERLAQTHVWLPYLEEAEELSVDFSIDFDGVDSGFGVRRRVRASGFAVISDSVTHPRVEELMRRFTDRARGLGARGVLNVQWIARGDELYLSDVNPRVGTSSVHWLGTGFNPVLHVCSSVAPFLREGRTRAVPASRRRTVRYLEEVRIDEPEAPSSSPVIRGVVFDVDDTLVPHKRWILEKLERLYPSFTAELPERTAFLREAMRLLEQGSWGRLFDDLGSSFGFDPVLGRRLLEAYRAVRPEACPIYPDVLPTLDSLKRLGLRIAVLTDNPPASQRQKLEASGLVSLLDAVVYAREVGGEKPDPRGFARVASALGTEPASLAMVGDNPYRDMLGAAAAGYGALYLIARPGGFFNFDPELFARMADKPARVRTIAGLRELLWYLP